MINFCNMIVVSLFRNHPRHKTGLGSSCRKLAAHSRGAFGAASSCRAIDLAHDYRREITYFARAMRGPLNVFEKLECYSRALLA